MTGLQQYKCPICGSQFGTEIGVVNHINGSTKGGHAGESGADHREDIKTVSIDEPAADRGDRAESGDGSGAEPAQFPTADRGEPDTEPDTEPAGDRGCCGDPDLSPAEGRYRLNDGRIVAADHGDEFCSSCEAIVEDDGTVLR